MGICRHGSCFSLRVRACTGALLSEKQMGSAPGWLQLPWRILVALPWPQGLIRAFPPTQAVLPAFGKWGYRGWMVLPLPGSSSQPVRDFFLPGSCSNKFLGVFLKCIFFQGNFTRESAAFSSDCSLCGLYLSSARHTEAFRRGTGLFQGVASNRDPKPVLLKAIK